MASLVFELSVELDDGQEPYVVVADQRDVARWEVQDFGWPIIKMEDRASMVFFRFLAWSASFRQQRTALPWEQFDAILVEAMPVDDEEGEDAAPDDAEDPGQPAPSGTPMSFSPASPASH